MIVVDVLIPAFNEEQSIVSVLDHIPKDLVRDIIVINNNSTDSTAKIASEYGVYVVHETRQGYGWACLKGIEFLKNKKAKPDVVVFLDADFSDYPEQIKDLIKPIVEENKDLVIGSRSLGIRAKRSMPFQQRFGNWLAIKLIQLFYGTCFTDLGPFRAIVFNKLINLKMEDKTYGWTVEMQLKAVKNKYRIVEVPVNYRERIGVSKISGTLKGTLLAGYKIIQTIFKYTLR